MFGNGLAARCESCGEALYDGDMAYDLGGRYYCIACVEDALVVCRSREEDDHSYEDLMINLYAEQE